MKHSKIIIDTVNDSNDISSILFKLKLLLDDLGNDMINTWIDSELNGYDKDEQIPNYRRITSPLYGRIQTICYGTLMHQTIQIPVKVDQMDYLKNELRDNITSIEKWSKEKESDKKLPVDLRIANSITALEISEAVQIMQAWMPIPPAAFDEIRNAVRGRVLTILMSLEKEYGNLDEYYIDFGSSKEKKRIGKQINNIIFNDNSVRLGDNNTIKESKLG